MKPQQLTWREPAFDLGSTVLGLIEEYFAAGLLAFLFLHCISSLD